ncbi:krox-like protein. putative [Plasmodium cynomolgi strain B]|uniref:Krox-like protein. putative n=1 Tax=Plasmodium cynomolgi (strain B) TaxID=1120755 RepID=K6UX41_PLACD|nr:krox-like protein. putative [Plasmodium cynomolgi strain B]GAB68304.1 krox-like protein. putative [Plasmodium cynomolgi strain B]
MTANFKNKTALCYLDENLNSNSYSESEKIFLKNNINWNKINVLKCNQKKNEEGSSCSSSAGILMDMGSGNNNYVDSANYNDVSINYKNMQKFKSSSYSGDANREDRSVLSKRKYNHLSEEYEKRKRKLSPLDLFEDADDGDGGDDGGDGHVDSAASHENPNKDHFTNKYDFEFVENYKNVYLNKGGIAGGVAQGKIPKKHMQEEEDDEEEEEDVLANSQVSKDGSSGAEQDEDFPNVDGNGSSQVEGKYQIDKIYGTCLENVESSFILTKNMKKSYKNFIQNEKKKIKDQAEGYTNESAGNVYTSTLEGNGLLYSDDLGLNCALEEEGTAEEDEEEEVEMEVEMQVEMEHGVEVEEGVEREAEKEVEVEGEEYFNTPKNYPTRETNDLKGVLDMPNGAHEKTEEGNNCSDSKNEEARSKEVDGDYNYTCNDKQNDHSFEGSRLGQQQNSNNDDGNSGRETHPTDGQSNLTEAEKETQFFTPSQTVDKRNLVSTFKDDEDEEEQDQAEGQINEHIPAKGKKSNKRVYKKGNLSVPTENINVKEEKEKGLEEDQETHDSDSENGNVLKSVDDLDHVPISGSQLEKPNSEECNGAVMEERSFPVVRKEKQEVEDNTMGTKRRDGTSPGLVAKSASAAIKPVGPFTKQKDTIIKPVVTINKPVCAINKQINKAALVERKKKQVRKNCLIKAEVPKENSEVNSPATMVRVKRENCEDDIRKEGMPMSVDNNTSKMDKMKENFGTIRIKMEVEESEVNIKTEPREIPKVNKQSEGEQLNECEKHGERDQHYEDGQHDASPALTQSISMNVVQSGDANKCPKTVGERASSRTSEKARDRNSAQTSDNAQSKRRSMFYENMSSKISRIFFFSSKKANNNEPDGNSDSERESQDRKRDSDNDKEGNDETSESDENEQKEASESNDSNGGSTDKPLYSTEKSQEDGTQKNNTAQLKDLAGEGDEGNDEHSPSEGKSGEENENLQTYENRDGGDGKVGDNNGDEDLTSRTKKGKSPLGTKKVGRRKIGIVKKEPLGAANLAEIETRTCNLCNSIFANSKLMQRHVMSVHSEERPYECEICLKRYKRADHLKLHRIKHDLNKEDKKFQCSICQMFFKTPRQLKNCKLKHMKCSLEGERHTGGSESGTWRGDAAPKQAGTELSEQREEADERQVEADERQVEGDKQQVEGDQRQVETDKRQVEAQEQQANAEQRWELKKENCSPSRISVEIRTCNVCNMIFANKKLMKRHLMSVHSESRPYKCHLCIKTYKRSDHLKKHILTHKDNKEKIKYTCSICQASFDTPKELRSHKIRHYTCPYENCSYSYSTISKMKYHLNKHKCNLFYSCPVCSKKFLIYKEFIQHKRSCFKKKYVCLQCNKIYLHVNGYNKHVRKVHLNIIQNYKCTVNNCSKEFSSEFSLKEHIINFHHRVKRFFCSKCNMSFGYRSSFRRHNINIHP